MNDELVKKYHDAIKDRMKELKKEKVPAIYTSKIECDIRCFKKCTFDPTVGTVRSTMKNGGEEIDGTEYDNMGPYYCPKWYSENEVGWNYIELTVFLVVVIVVIIVVVVITVLACKVKKTKKNNVSSASADGQLHPIAA